MRLTALIIAALLPLCAPAQNELNSEAGMVGRWLVNGWQTGNGALPSVALPLAGSVAGGFSNAPAWSNALATNGTNQYFAASLPLNSALGLSFWANIETLTANKTAVDGVNNLAHFGSIYLAARSNGTMQVYAGAWRTSSFVMTPQRNTFFFLRWSSNANAAPYELFVDGTLVFSNNFSAAPAPALLSLAARRDALTQAYSVRGRFWDVRLWNRVVSAAEIKRLYEDGVR